MRGTRGVNKYVIYGFCTITIYYLHTKSSLVFTLFDVALLGQTQKCKPRHIVFVFMFVNLHKTTAADDKEVNCLYPLKIDFLFLFIRIPPAEPSL